MIYLDVDTALSEVPVNTVPLTDDSDFKSLEESVAYNASGLELIWHFITPSGSYTTTVVTPTSGGTYDWAHQDGAMYTIEIPASGGASINNDTEGFGWFTGKATGVLPWRGPTICFRAAGLNNLLIENAFSAIRGLAGTALPDAAAGASGGVITHGTGTAQLNVAGGKAPATVAAGDIANNAITAAAIATGAIDADSIASDAITAAKIASDAFTAAKFASDVTTEFQNGLATATALATLQAAFDSLTADAGTAQAGASNSITLQSGASSDDGYYDDAAVVITAGTGAGQTRKITGYVGSTRVATVDENWVTDPDNTSEYKVIGRIV